MSVKLQFIVEDIRRAMAKTPYSHHTVEKDELQAILDYIEPKLEEERQRINLGDTVQIIEPMMDNRIGVVIRESEYPLFTFVLRLPDNSEVSVFQEDVRKIHE